MLKSMQMYPSNFIHPDGYDGQTRLADSVDEVYARNGGLQVSQEALEQGEQVDA